MRQQPPGVRGRGREEHNNRLKWSPARDMVAEGADRIPCDLDARRRVLRASVFDRGRSTRKPPLVAKAHCVVIGCEGPDLAEFERNSPTPSPLSLMLVLLRVYISGHQTCGWVWSLRCVDAAAVVLQGSAKAWPYWRFIIPPWRREFRPRPLPRTALLYHRQRLWSGQRTTRLGRRKWSAGWPEKDLRSIAPIRCSFL